MFIRFSWLLLLTTLSFSSPKFVNAMQQNQNENDSRSEIERIIENYFQDVENKDYTKFDVSLKDELIELLCNIKPNKERMKIISNQFRYVKFQQILATIIALHQGRMSIVSILDFLIKAFNENKIIINKNQNFNYLIKIINKLSHTSQTKPKIVELLDILQTNSNTQHQNIIRSFQTTPNQTSALQKRTRNQFCDQTDNATTKKVIALQEQSYTSSNSQNFSQATSFQTKYSKNNSETVNPFDEQFIKNSYGTLTNNNNNNQSNIMHRNKQRRTEEAFLAYPKLEKIVEKAQQLFPEHQAQDIALLIQDAFLKKLAPHKGISLLVALKSCVKENDRISFIQNLLFRVIDFNKEYKNIDKNAVFAFVERTIQKNNQVDLNSIKTYLESRLNNSFISSEESVIPNIKKLIRLLEEKIREHENLVVLDSSDKELSICED